VQAVRDTGTPMGDAVDPLTDGETRSMPNLSSSGYHALAASPTAMAVTSGPSLYMYALLSLRPEASIPRARESTGDGGT